MNKGTKVKQIKKSGFRARIKSVSGRRIIKYRRNKKRCRLSL
uniref:Ribosomal protein L34 n=1 Tax=Caloglossa intermedia TaxID=100879 RepID=A0A1Z1M621_9FLOR|nr:ribosomal protein L34 [Caloglossa intermedia]ARW61352.1 ribosomal protein L34 [Caloglossa intermedia]